jgi:hypothetical protein
MHDPLIEFATVTPTPLHEAVLAARTSLHRAAADLLTVPDAALDRPWRWRPTDRDDLELRYGFYAIHERLEAAIGAIAVGRASAAEPIGPAVPALAVMATARWELRGVLAPLAEADWDAEPGGDEWTIRQTVGHTVLGQRIYGWYNAWYIRQGVVGAEVERPSEDHFPPEPTEEDEATGDPATVMARFDEVVDANAVATAGLGEAAMGISGRWSGLPVTIDFRLGRYGSHIREHTIQVDKTLAMLGRQATESERLVRLILATYGRLEAELVGRPVHELDRPLADGRSPATILTDVVDETVATASNLRAAVGG